MAKISDLVRRLPPWALAAVAALAVFGWQWTTVTANYGGNWTALFCTGSVEPPPALVAAERIYIFQGSTGYDGQIYHYIAHDPFLQTGLGTSMGDARFRYRRILVPALAYALALGRFQWIDGAFVAVCLLSIALGVYWACRYTQMKGLAAAWGLLFLLFPGTPVTVDRLVLDGALAAATAAFLLYAERPGWKLFLVLCCAPLIRETGFLLIAGYCGWLLLRRRWGMAAAYLSSVLPALAWFAYVGLRTAPSATYRTSLVPFSGIIRAALHPFEYPPGTPLIGWVQAADGVALGGCVLAIVLAFMCFVRRPADPTRIAMVLFAALAVILQRTDVWQNAFNYGRIFAPLFVCLGAMAAQTRRASLLLPAALMAPRLAIQFAPQILGIARWMGGR